MARVVMKPVRKCDTGLFVAVSGRPHVQVTGSIYNYSGVHYIVDVTRRCDTYG